MSGTMTAYSVPMTGLYLETVIGSGLKAFPLHVISIARNKCCH